MSTLAVALKDEIRRLARKEIKVQTGAMSRAVIQHRREALKAEARRRVNSGEYFGHIAYMSIVARKHA